MRLLENEDAASLTVGVVLAVGIVVILAAISANFLFDMGDPGIKGPTASIIVKNAPETSGIIDMKIVHAGGDTIKAGDWKLSVVKAGNQPAFKFGSTDFSVGDQIITTNLTDGNGTYTITNNRIYTTGSADTFEAGTRYDVQIIVYPFKTLTVDTVVTLK